MKNYYVLYEVIGSACTGSYFVQADNKRQAKSKVKALDEDYCRLRALNSKEYADEYSMDEEEVQEDLATYLANLDDGICHIESGT